jgi:hypothetical protein
MALFDELQQSLRTLPTPDTGPTPEISGLFALPAAARLSNAVAGAGARAGVADINQQKAVEQFQTQDKINTLRAKSRATSDAASAASRANSLAKAKKEGFERVVNPTGGYTFVSPEGKPISAYEFSRATGTPLGSALSGSLDPEQTSFIQDYQNVFDFNQLVLDYASIDPKMKNKSAVSKIQKREAAGKKLSPEEKVVLDYIDASSAYPEFINKTPGEMTQAVVQQYPGIFGSGQFQAPNVGGEAAPPNPQDVAAQPNRLQSFFGGLFNSLRGLGG